MWNASGIERKLNHKEDREYSDFAEILTKTFSSLII